VLHSSHETYEAKEDDEEDALLFSVGSTLLLAVSCWVPCPVLSREKGVLMRAASRMI